MSDLGTRLRRAREERGVSLQRNRDGDQDLGRRARGARAQRLSRGCRAASSAARSCAPTRSRSASIPMRPSTSSWSNSNKSEREAERIARERRPEITRRRSRVPRTSAARRPDPPRRPRHRRGRGDRRRWSISAGSSWRERATRPTRHATAAVSSSQAAPSSSSPAPFASAAAPCWPPAHSVRICDSPSM